MKRVFFAASAAFAGLLGFANEGVGARLADDPAFRYEVRFTNPECREYRYREEVKSVSGERLRAKPRGAYCTGADTARSADRPESPFTKIVGVEFTPRRVPCATPSRTRSACVDISRQALKRSAFSPDAAAYFFRSSP